MLRNAAKRKYEFFITNIFHQQLLTVVIAGISTFIAMTLYFRAVYSLLSIMNDYTMPIIMGMSVFVISMIIFIIEDTLGNILAVTTPYDNDNIDNNTNHPGYLFGTVDKDLQKCFGIPFHIQLSNRKIFLARFIYYNFNALLFATAWYGVDVIRQYTVGYVTQWRIGPRIAVDIAYLIASNLGFLFTKQFLSQFGVPGDRSVLVRDDDDGYDFVLDDGSQRHIRSKSLVNQASHPSTDASKPPTSTVENSPETIMKKFDFIGTVSSGSMDRASVSLPNTLNQSLTGDRTKDIKSKPFLDCCSYSCSNRMKKQAQTIGTFIALTMFWSSIWDLFGAIPRETLIGQEDAHDIDDQFDDDYDRHHGTGKADAVKMVSLGLGYCVASFAFLVITGELWTAINHHSNETKMIRESLSKKIENMGLKIKISSHTVVWKIGHYYFLPLQLLDYNIKGLFVILAWVGIVTLVHEFERNVLFSGEFNQYILIACEIMWILLANIMLMLTEEFGNLYGGHDSLATEHEIIHKVDSQGHEI